MKKLKILDLACGTAKTPGAIGIDRLEIPEVDIVHNLDEFPYPFKENMFDRVVCYNGMEHLQNPLDVLAELHRICKKGATVYIASPHFSSVDFFTDPTHKHPFSSRSFDYIIPGTKLFDLNYDKARYSKESVRITFDIRGIWGKFLTWFANHKTELYERRFAFIFPAHQVIFSLRVEK